ncbi:hypothetical protein SUSAZ_07975 [Sulfolobus acidocaldarius SUSAZ]|nr:hypothetical protein SUSAZ_07975 [Sulfolobus acidocaldarius SUSAZ]
MSIIMYRRMKRQKLRIGLSIPIGLLIFLVILALVLVPAIIIFNSSSSYLSQSNIANSGQQQLKEKEQQQIFRGNPNIFYNSTKNPPPTLVFIYNNIPVPFNISTVYYFNGTMWLPVTKNIVVGYNVTLPLPNYVFNKPLLIVSALSNFYFLYPNTSVTAIMVSGPVGKIPVYITAFAINGSRYLPLNVNMRLGQENNFSSPKIFYLTPGTYQLTDNNIKVFLQQYGLTAQFMNWSYVGNGQLTSATSPSTTFTVTGPLVITAVYKTFTQTYKVLIMPNNIPLGTSLTYNIKGNCNGNGKGGCISTTVTLTSLNTTIPVFVDNRLYQVGQNGITLSLSYGYHIIQFPSSYNITFNYTGGYFTKPVLGGQITTYTFTNLLSSSSNISVLGNTEIFLNGSGTVKGVFSNTSTYYLVTVYNNFAFPNNVYYYTNNTPVLGNIAAQLLGVTVSTTGQNIVLGPTQNYVPEKIYFKANTNLNIYIDYLNTINGTFTIFSNYGKGSYIGLLSYPNGVQVYNVFSYSGGRPQTYNPQANNGNYGTIQVISPLIIINNQVWEYGGVENG